jgi:hypothetical protein
LLVATVQRNTAARHAHCDFCFACAAPCFLG